MPVKTWVHFGIFDCFDARSLSSRRNTEKSNTLSISRLTFQCATLEFNYIKVAFSHGWNEQPCYFSSWIKYVCRSKQWTVEHIQVEVSPANNSIWLVWIYYFGLIDKSTEFSFSFNSWRMFSAGGGGGLAWTSDTRKYVCVSRLGGTGALPEKLGGGVRPASQNPYPIYDKNLRYSLPYLSPDQ